MESDICIIGAGPAGMMACLGASIDKKIIIVESNITAGRKLLLTGRGRCNLTHSGAIDEFIKAYKPFDKFVRHSIHEFSPMDLREFFANRGLETIEEPDGSVFPKTNCSSDVKKILLDELKKPNIRIFYGKKVQSIIKQEDFFIINTEKINISAQSVIIATGGVSWPQTGSTGDGYKFAQSLGHNIVQPKACVVPLVTAEKFCSILAGVGIPKVKINCKVDGKKISTSGPMLFTHKGIGGPAVLDLSRFLTDKLNGKNKIEIQIDLLPDFSDQRLDKTLADCLAQNPRQNIVSVLTQFLPKALVHQICLQNGLNKLQAGKINRQTRRLLIDKLKNLKLNIISTESIEKATVTRGGVDNTQIDSLSMQSKLCRGLFFAGECINIDGPCGGYNLQFAFSSGFLAGKSATNL